MSDNLKSIVFTFKTPESEDGSVEDTIIVELDSEKTEEIYGDGKNSFYPGDKVYFRCWVPSGRPIGFTTSAGVVASESTGKVSKDIRFQFTGTEEDKEKSVNIPLSAVTEVTWYGRSLGDPVVSSAFKLTFPATGVAICDLIYETTSFGRYSLTISSIPEDISAYPVLVVIDFTDGGSE